MNRRGDKPKKASSAYLCFISKCLKDATPPIKKTQVMKEAAKKWKLMSEEERLPFIEAAAEDKRRYNVEMEAFYGNPNKPRKPPTAYLLYLADFRAKHSGASIAYRDILKMAGASWKNLGAEEKDTYTKKAQEARDNYKSAMQEYKLTGSTSSGKAKKAPNQNGDQDDQPSTSAE
ncbi:hypothetical protein BsWGS_22279 [Bradybaena similaris]